MIKNTWAALKFGIFVLWSVAQIPVLVILWPFPRRLRIIQFHICSWVIAKIFGLRFRINGKISKHRPLLLVANHISIFELLAFPALFRCGFFAKGEVREWPVLGWMTGMFGNFFIERNPMCAIDAIKTIRSQMLAANVPYAIFPEGTTTNGNYILPFKSALFESFNGTVAKIQPITILYRDKHGNKIPPQVMADEYAYFANSKQSQPPFAKRELSAAELLWKTLIRGGFVVEVHILPLYDAHGQNRKQMADTLFAQISEKFEELK